MSQKGLVPDRRLVPDREELEQLEARIRARLQILGIDVDAPPSPPPIPEDTLAAVFGLPTVAKIEKQFGPKFVKQFGPKFEKHLEPTLAKARQGDRNSRQVLGMWWRYRLYEPARLPRVLAEYLAEAFDREDLHTALGFSREPGQRGRNAEGEKRLQDARVAIVRYLVFELDGGGADPLTRNI